jgi:hypothetical protein
MTVQADIKAYIAGQPQPKRDDLEALHKLVLQAMPKAKLWFLDGKNDAGKVVSNPNIGYGSTTLTTADGKSREFYQVGISANTSGISIYVMGLADKTWLARACGKTLGKASVSGYCIKFKALKDIDSETLTAIIRARAKLP